MQYKNLMLFVYDFPHKKSQDFILRLIKEGFNIKYLLAAPFKKLPHSIKKSQPMPTKKLIHPKELAKKHKIKYLVAEHNSKKAIYFIKKNPVDIGVIGGARILSKEVIDALSNKLINVHPALLPEVRGLNTLYKSIYSGDPPGITVHFINFKIDSGYLIYKEQILLNKTDTINTVSLALINKQPDLLIKALHLLNKNELKLINLDLDKSDKKKYPQAKTILEKQARKKFSGWLKKFVK